MSAWTPFRRSPKTGSSDWQTETAIGVLGIRSFFEDGIPVIYLDPREIVVLNTGVLCRHR